MKPTIQFSETRTRGDSPERGFPKRCAFPKTDHSYHAASIENVGGRGLGFRRPSFRAISQDYFKNEAPQSFAMEAALFGVIVMTAALPLLNGASELIHLIRSIGSV